LPEVVAMRDRSPTPDLREQLDRWVADGLMDAGQAKRIEAAEAQRTVAARAHRTGAVPLIAEALGYVGGVLAVVASFVSVGMLWPDIPVSVQLVFAAVTAAVLGIAASVMRTGDEPALARLRSVLWFLSTAGVATFTGVLADQVLHLSVISSSLVTAAVTDVYAVLAWWRTRSSLQHLVAFYVTAVGTAFAIARFAPGLHWWGPGLGVWVVSALWGTAVYRGYLRPAGAGYFASGAGLLVGAMMTMQEAAGHVLALATVASLLVAGIALRRLWLVALGTVGVILVVPQTAYRYLPHSAARPLAILVAGLVLIGVALWLAKGRKAPGTGQPPAG
jgi:hypothetical protein